MAKKINSMKNISLSELDWKKGEVLGIDNSSPDMFHPFIIAVPEKITGGFDARGFRFTFQHTDPLGKNPGRVEEYTLHPRGYVLALQFAGINGTPRYDILEDCFPHGNPYEADRAYSGKDEIKQALNSMVGFSYYAHLMNKKELIVERGPVGSFLEKLSLGLVLPNQVRFKSYDPIRVVKAGL